MKFVWVIDKDIVTHTEGHLVKCDLSMGKLTSILSPIWKVRVISQNVISLGEMWYLKHDGHLEKDIKMRFVPLKYAQVMKPFNMVSSGARMLSTTTSTCLHHSTLSPHRNCTFPSFEKDFFAALLRNSSFVRKTPNKE